jgi:hypothetical protein
MDTEDNEQPPDGIMAAPERPLWEFSRDEGRVLIVTFVGGLASIVVGASVIGGAIALVRALKPTHSLLVFLIFITTVYIFVVVLVAIALSRRGRLICPELSGQRICG